MNTAIKEKWLFLGDTSAEKKERWHYTSVNLMCTSFVLRTEPKNAFLKKIHSLWCLKEKSL